MKNKIRKSDDEVLNYLNPYINKPGIVLEFLIVIEQQFEHILVDVDVKSAFDSRTDSNRIKKYLKRNGFKYNYGTGFLRATNNGETNIDSYNVKKYLLLY